MLARPTTNSFIIDARGSNNEFEIEELKSHREAVWLIVRSKFSRFELKSDIRLDDCSKLAAKLTILIQFTTTRHKCAITISNGERCVLQCDCRQMVHVNQFNYNLFSFCCARQTCAALSQLEQNSCNGRARTSDCNELTVMNKWCKRRQCMSGGVLTSITFARIHTHTNTHADAGCLKAASQL